MTLGVPPGTRQSSSTSPPPDAPPSCPEPGRPAARPGRRLGLAGAAGVALSLGLVTWLIGHLDWPAVGRALARAAPGPLVLATVGYSGLFVLRGLRWTFLLAPLTPPDRPTVGLRLATRAFLVGFMANNLLPARLGDVVRALVLAREARVARSATFATVLLERIFDGVTVVGILGVALLAVERSEGTRALEGVAALMGLVFGGALLVCVLLATSEEVSLRWLARLLRPLPAGPTDEVLALSRRIAAGLHALRTPGRTLMVAVLSVLVWALEVGVYTQVAAALGLELSVLGLALVMSVLTLGLTAPSAPGFVGVFEALVIPALGLLGVQAEPAAAFALVLHAIHYAPGTALGLVAAVRSGYRLSELRASGR